MTSSPTYDRATITLHWLTVALVLSLWSIAQLWGFLPKGSAPRHALQWLHVGLGLFFITVLLARLLWRATAGRRLEEAPGSRLLALAAQALHGLLYLLLLAMAVTGPINRWAQGDPLGIPGLFIVPAPFTATTAFADRINDIHGTIASVILILAAFHAAAALAHHFLWHDDVLGRMLPGLKPFRH